VLRGADLQVERGERIALVGPNGAGKSTLMRLLAGVEEPVRGARSEGHNLQLAYFAQDQARVLHAEKSVLQELTDAAPFAMVPKVRDILGSFLFSGDEVEKKVKVLSGGERNRLALAILLLRPANLLLLDEPTNHLDLLSKEVLLQALKGYSGTLVFVSHDRYFVDQLATRVIEVGGGEIGSWPGNYEDFLQAKAVRGDLSHSSLRVEQGAAKPTTAPAAVREDRRQSHQERKASQRAEQRRQKELGELEGLIELREGSLTALEQQMADPQLYQDAERWRTLSAEHQQLQDEIAGLYQRWEALQLASA